MVLNAINFTSPCRDLAYSRHDPTLFSSKFQHKPDKIQQNPAFFAQQKPACVQQKPAISSMIPTFYFCKGRKVKGTFRSTSCARVGLFEDESCSACCEIPKLQSFRKRAILRQKKMKDGKRDTTYINSHFLTRNELMQKISDQHQTIETQESQLFFATSKALRLKLYTKSFKEKLVEYARRGSMKSICYKLNRVAEEGKLKDKPVLTDLLHSVANNLHVAKQGKRYKASFQMFFEVILMWGGPRLANFVALNVFGPEVHSIFRWWRKNTPPM